MLDNNILNRLLDPTCPFTVEDLVAAYQSGNLEIVGSLELLEEVMGTARKNPAKFRRLWKLWRKLIGRRTLMPLDERHRLELLGDGRLPVAQRYLPRSIVREIGATVARPAAMAEINSMVNDRKKQSLNRDYLLKAEILGEIKGQGKRVRDFDRRVSNEQVFDSVSDLIATGPDYGLPTIASSEIEFERLPSAWLLCSVTAARATRVAGENRSVKASDNHDRLHAAAGAYFDVLVTDDAEFKETIRLMPDLPFKVCSAEEFALLLRTLTGQTDATQ